MSCASATCAVMLMPCPRRESVTRFSACPGCLVTSSTTTRRRSPPLAAWFTPVSAQSGPPAGHSTSLESEGRDQSLEKAGNLLGVRRERDDRWADVGPLLGHVPAGTAARAAIATAFVPIPARVYIARYWVGAAECGVAGFVAQPRSVASV